MGHVLCLLLRRKGRKVLSELGEERRREGERGRTRGEKGRRGEGEDAIPRHGCVRRPTAHPQPPVDAPQSVNRLGKREGGVALDMGAAGREERRTAGALRGSEGAVEAQ